MNKTRDQTNLHVHWFFFAHLFINAAKWNTYITSMTYPDKNVGFGKFKYRMKYKGQGFVAPDCGRYR